jgi:hypothetical protein
MAFASPDIHAPKDSTQIKSNRYQELPAQCEWQPAERQLGHKRMEMMRASLAHLHQVNNSEKHVHNPRPLNGAEIAEAFQTMFSTVAAMISVPQQRNADRDTIPSRLCPTRLELTAQRIGL